MDLTTHPNALVRELAGVFPDHCAFPVGRMRSFQGLSATDRAVFCEVLDREKLRPDAWWVEAPLGDLPDWAKADDAPGWWKDFAWQYQLRADLVHVKGDQVFVTEIKGEVRTSAVGQVLTYTFLLQRQLGVRIPVQPSILGRTCIREVRDFCGAVGINLWTLDGVK